MFRDPRLQLLAAADVHFSQRATLIGELFFFRGVILFTLGTLRRSISEEWKYRGLKSKRHEVILENIF